MLDRPFLIRTPESVEFAFREAGMWTRFLAWSIDATLIGALFICGGTLLGLLSSITFGLASPLMYVFAFLLTSGYFIWCEWRMGGSSPGKRRFGLRVIRDDGLRLTLSESVVRNLLRIVDSLPGAYGVALLVAAAANGSRRLGDHVASTLVIVEPRVSAPRAVRADVVTALASDPLVRERVRRRTSTDERDILISAVLRREEMRMEARIEVFAALAKHFGARLGIERPAHLSAERFVCDLAAALWI